MKSKPCCGRLAGVSRADLHIHSKYSDRPSEWLLRRIGAPESFVEPKALYDRCRRLGMDYVTITDHNCIRGALEIADLPGTFISTELTTYFPDNGCKIHCLALGITARQFETLNELRENIFDLRNYMLEQNIIHSVAHPLFRVNDRLTIEHVEQLLLLFNRFEGINGARVPLACNIAKALFESLTPETITRLVDKHGIEPVGPTPWRKVLTGGSDDHGGLYPAHAYTETPKAASVFDYLQHLRDGEHSPGGRGGSSLQLASSLIQIACHYVQQRTFGRTGSGFALFQSMLETIAELPERQERKTSPFRKAIRVVTAPIVRRQQAKQLNETERMLVEELSRIMRETGDMRTETAGDPQQQRFRFVSRVGHELSYAFVCRFVKKIREGSLIGAIESVASLSPVALGFAPYVTAFSTQHKDNAFLRDVATAFDGAAAGVPPPGRKAWVTDTYNDVNGVARTIHTLASLSTQRENPITVVTCLDQTPEADYPLRNFTPVGSFAVPEYQDQRLNFPPLLDVIAFLEEGQFEDVLISTPGPLGLCALFAARLLGIPAKGIYHTDFPQYVEQWTADEAMGEITKRFMKWFYGCMETIYAPTQAYADELGKLGFTADVLDVLPRGVDLELFSSSYRTEGFWQSRGLEPGFTYVYVGRVSSEKNLDVLMEAFKRLNADGHVANLALVGKGPEFERLNDTYGQLPGVCFAGFMHGEELAAAYASADALVFPSMTDTFGNVVLEAHASDLPVIVSDRGGPREIVETFRSGLVVDATSPTSFCEAMAELVSNRDLYEHLRERSIVAARESQWESVLNKILPLVA